MRRIQVIIGTIVLIAGWLVWNNLFGMSGETRDFGRTVPSAPTGLYISWFFLIVAILVWYGLNWIHMINEWDRRPVLKFGRYIKTAGPGLVFLEPLIFTTLDDIPVQDVVVTVEAAEVQTKDNVNVGLTGVLTYRIDAEKVQDAVVQVEDVTDAILQRALSTLTDSASANDLDHLLEHRSTFCGEIEKTVKTRVSEWGVTVKAFELKAFKINDAEIAQAIAMKARAQKEAAAELTRANMQKQIAAALNEAAATYNGQGRWLKGMEVLIELCRSAQNNTILLPTDLQGLVGRVAQLMPGSSSETPPTA